MNIKMANKKCSVRNGKQPNRFTKTQRHYEEHGNEANRKIIMN
jgi:hypothetical protein